MAIIVTNGLGLELRGKAGNAVFAQTRYGLVLRPRTQPRNPQTPAQMAARKRLSTAAGLWKTLSPTQQAAWQAYAQTLPLLSDNRHPAPALAPHLEFIGLASKFLQVHPAGNVPLEPPTAPFFGDSISVTAMGGTGQVVFTASGPNRANIVTELLLQPLAHGTRAPKANLYRPTSFVAFASGSLSHTVTLAPGWYAPAYRFVNALTGQEVGMARLASVQA